MPQEPIDLSKTLKKLFERTAPPRDPAARALFGPGPTSPEPSSAPPVEEKPVSSMPIALRVSQGVTGLRNRVGEMFKFLPTRSVQSRAVIGVDLGASSVKVARMESIEGHPQLTGVAVEELPEGVSEGPDWDKAVRDILQRLKRTGLLNGPIVMGFHHIDSVVEPIRMPKMPMSELNQSVLWEAKERLSLSPERSVIRFLVSGEVSVDNQLQFEILVVAAPKDHILAQWRMLADIGLKVVAIEPVNLAGFYVLSKGELWKSSELVGILEIGMRASHLCFVRNKAVQFTRSFQVASDSFTRSIADYCEVDYSEGERLKRKFGISKMALEEDRQETGHAADERVRVSHALGLHMEKLVAEIEQSYRYFAFELGRTDAQRMDRLIVTGGGGLLKNLPDFLAERLSVPVSAADPMKVVKLDGSLLGQIQGGWNLRLAVALGLALRPML